MYPDILPKGTIIRIGVTPSLNKTAINLEIALEKDVKRKEGNMYESTKGIVKKNPNGWHSKTAWHSIHLGIDEIIGGPLATNKMQKAVLERYDN